MTDSPPPSERAFVLGLDGVPWHLIERWTDDGTLPNFTRLRDEGAAGPLDSTRPASTPLAWPSIATGVRPDKHGIYGFQNLSGGYSHEMYTSRDRREPALWEQLSPSIVGNVPMTYPPSEIDGTLVSGLITPSTDEQYTYPAAFADEIEAEIPGYEISLDYPEYADRLDDFQVAVDEMLENRRRLLRLLMEREADWKLFFFVFTAPDRFQHLIWDEDLLLEHYLALDDILGEVLEYVDERDADLYVVSDHGFGPIDTLVYVNHLLEEAGYLVRREDEGTRSALSTLGVSRDAVTSVLDALGISQKKVLTALPDRVVGSIASRIPGDHALYDVDYERTVAFVHGSGNLYINDEDRFAKGIVSPAEIPEFKAELTTLFESVTAPGSDEPILRVYDGDERFPTDDDAPDLVVNGRGEYETRTTITDEPFGDPGATTASHRADGIVLCRGPSIEAGHRITDASVVDVAPTLLHALDEPVPANADGRVLFDAFREDAHGATATVERASVARDETDESVDDDFTEVEDRLKGLGYME